MGYKNIKPVLINLDTFPRSCGLFDGETDLNNGYGCRSRSKEKEHPGCCHGFDCPLAILADMAHINEHDVDLYNEYLPDFQEQLDAGASEEDCNPSYFGSDWMIQYRSL